MESTLARELLVLMLFLLTAALSYVFLRRAHFPFTIGLVVVGGVVGGLAFGAGEFTLLKSFVLSPNVIMYAILPTLIFDAAIHIDGSLLRKNFGPIMLLAVGGVVLSALITGVGMSALTPMSFMPALLFGALIAATDPVAVVALFDEVGAPQRLKTLVDGESLFNDATAIVAFHFVLALLMGHYAGPGSGLVSFAVTLVGGAVVGGLVGLAGILLIKIEKGNRIFITTLTIVAAYSSFIVANYYLDVSGVVATLTTGMILRRWGMTNLRFSLLKRVGDYWGFYTFVANSMIFLLLGLTQVQSFIHNSIDTGAVVVVLITALVVTSARAAVIYGLIPLYNRRHASYTVSEPEKLILFWGGLRGAVPVALVLLIPEDVPHRELIVHCTFGYILFTLFVQGATMPFLMKRFHLQNDATPLGDRPVLRDTYYFPTERLAFLIYDQYLDDLRNSDYYVHVDSKEHQMQHALVRRGDEVHEVTLVGAQIDVVSEVTQRETMADHLRYTVQKLQSAVQGLESVGFLRSQAPNAQKSL